MAIWQAAGQMTDGLVRLSVSLSVCLSFRFHECAFMLMSPKRRKANQSRLSQSSNRWSFSGRWRSWYVNLVSSSNVIGLTDFFRPALSPKALAVLITS